MFASCSDFLSTYSSGWIDALVVVVAAFDQSAGASIGAAGVGNMNGVSTQLAGCEFAINQCVNVA